MRRVLLALAIALALLTSTGTAIEAPKNRGNHRPPTLLLDNPGMARVVTVYNDAIRNLMQTNTVHFQGDHVIRAGANYSRPWTRDGSLNSMMAGSLLAPAIAENTLWHITDDRQAVSGQWWDRMIWVVAAWRHFQVTGDGNFLAEAYECTKSSLENQRRDFFVAEYGLFRGPSHLCDGIAGYPDPPAVNTDGGSSYCEDYPNLVYVMPTSLQAIYYGAYCAAADMAEALDRDQKEVQRWRELAAALKQKTDEHLWMPDQHRYGYLIHGKGPKAGHLETHQEGAGLAYALLFGMADDVQAHEIMKHFHNQSYGMTAVWPHFARFSDDRPGRHNVLVWPQMNAYWGLATLRRGRPDLFAWEFKNLTGLLHSTSPDIREIYDSVHGVPHGGFQSAKKWEATHHQTWGATGYLALVYNGLFGMQFEDEGIRFTPYLPPKWGDCRLIGLTYRDALLDITVSGSGSKITRFMIDGHPRRSPYYKATLRGKHAIDIQLR